MSPVQTTGATIEVEADDVLAVLRQVELATNTIGLREFLGGPVVEWLQERADHRFASEGDDASGQWPDLTWGTQQIREALGFPREHPINVRTGDLRDWVVNSDGKVSALGPLGAELEWPGTAPDAEIESKFKVAQKGANYGENPMFPTSGTVPRPVARVNAVDLEAVLEAYVMWLPVFVAQGAGIGNVAWASAIP